MNRISRAWHRVTEQLIWPAWGPFSFSGLRSRFRVFGAKFFGVGPAYENTIISYELARSLYRNDGKDFNLGAHFSRPIVDLQVDFIGLPSASVEDENIDDFLNGCLNYWGAQVQEMLRNSIRESRAIVRLRRDSLADPLATLEEGLYYRLELLNPEQVALQYEIGNACHLEKAYVIHRVMIVEEESEVNMGRLPIEREHEIIETITETDFTYWDRTTNEDLPDLNMPNDWGFVPIVEVINEYDSSLAGGQSDLEPVYPFIRAFHDVLSQALKAHKYHSIPKVVFQLNEIQSFLKNNFPNVFDQTTGDIKPGATISWEGREILFIKPEEKAEFLEARSVLGDSKTLLEFLIDCIVVASETPRWAFMVVDAGSANQAENAEVIPWIKKIERKRKYFEYPIQKLLKMAMKANGIQPRRPTLDWQIARISDQSAYNQALQFLIMGLEVAAQRQIISDTTYRETIRTFLPKMKNPSQEEKDAQDNFDALAAAAAAAPNNGGTNVPVTSGQQGKNE